MAKRNVIVGIDIGTTKIAAIIGEISEFGQVNIIGLGEAFSAGMRKGNIVDIENTARAIEQAVEKAERMSGVEVHSAFVGITGSHISCQNNKGVVAVSSEDKEIGVEDAHRVLQAARVISVPADRRIIHVLPRQYIVDGCDGIIDPVGMAGSRLEVETHIVTAASTSIQNILKSTSRAELEVEELVLNPLASAEAVLLPAEKELGAVVVDIGGGTTEIAIYDQGSMWFTSVLPVGGDYITSDVAVGLRTPIARAEELKKEHGCVLSKLMPDNEYIEVTAIGGQDTRNVTKKFLATIIEPRVQEIIGMVRQEIKRSGFKEVIPGGVVFTGGTSSMAGLTELAMQELNLPVRVGIPEQVGGLVDIVTAPSYATGIGLVLY
ncbi:MAG: cell division protein FtsA, partial [Bacillota bacterium]